jgi:hypothetical protein
MAPDDLDHRTQHAPDAPTKKDVFLRYVRSIFLLVVMLAVVGCNTRSESEQSGGGSSPQPSMIAKFCFNLIGTEATAVTVNFQGTLNGSSSQGQTKFSTQESRTINPLGSTYQCIDKSIYGLSSGTWHITAVAQGITAPQACDVSVPPGILTLDVSGDHGPSCRLSL